ncbi:hypothetical protein CC117_28990 [Parafrankia colletiae]|uniref:Uncharacterized protein n=1 Tax=Parafrankia colletiae TaxID=573497 RepID=A0A1S1Q7Z6_9ACTN|nr:hypothetical protein [Frankia sp. Cpl3]OHV29601.1 hypothetical protein CC117_28990 [Parafrankia colletiae]
MLRRAVCAFDDRASLAAEIHTLDALVSAMKRRQWLTADESLALHAALTALLPGLHGRPVLRHGAATEPARPVRRRPECVPALLRALPTARAQPDPVLDELVAALTTPAGVRTDRTELRDALDSLVSRVPRAPALDAATSVEQFELHLVSCVQAAQGRILGLAVTAADPTAAVLWVLLDSIRDGAWLTEASLEGLRDELFPPAARAGANLPIGPAAIGPQLDPEVAERVLAAANQVIADLRRDLAELHEDLATATAEELAWAADLAVDALSALSRQVLSPGQGDARVQSAVTRLRTTVIRAMADDDGSGRIIRPDGTDETRRERSAAAQETIDELAWRIRTAPTSAGLTILVADAIAALLERLDTPVSVDDLDAALQQRWPDDQ